MLIYDETYGVIPFQFFTEAEAPTLAKKDTVSTWPPPAATKRGVSPMSPSGAFTSAPVWTKTSTTSFRPSWAARYLKRKRQRVSPEEMAASHHRERKITHRAVALYSPKRMFTSAPNSSSNFTVGKDAFDTARASGVACVFLTR